MIVGDYTGESSEVVTDFLHLFLEVLGSSGWEVLKCLSHRCEFSYEHKHVLGQVVTQGLDGAGSWVRVAEVHDVKGWALELAGAQVFDDFGTVGENVDVTLDISDVLEDSEWVLEKVGVDGEVIDGFLIKTGVVLLDVSSLVERLGETLVPSTDTLNIPESVVAGFLHNWGIEFEGFNS